MKHVILLAALIWVAEFANAQTPTLPPGVIETYKVVNGMNIRATVYNVEDGRRHRVVIAIHGGGYGSGTMQTNVAQDVSQYGFMGVAIEYRLAPPHIEMNTPEHPFPGQNDIHDDGHYPEQTDDVRDAIVHYRNDPRSNGEVIVIGGSAGGSHGLYLVATGTPGYDMPDLAVLLSCGVSNLADPNQYVLECNNGETCPHGAAANYLNIPDPAPLPPTGTDRLLAQDASPSQWMHVGMCPFWAMCSSEDSLGIPTSTGFNIHSYNLNNTEGPLENGENGILPTALAIGLRESTASVPEADSFKTTIVDVSVHSHSFDYWDQVKSEVIPWISVPIPTPDCYPNFTTAGGCDALSLLTAGAGNTGLGWHSLFLDTTGSFNTGVGAGALVLNNGDSNTAVGAVALLLNTTGTQNTAVGTDALVFNDTGSANTATGYFALMNNTTGGSNTAVGGNALTANTTGNNNTAIGNQALQSNVTTSDHVALGNMAGSGITTADNNIIIGHHFGVHSVFGQVSDRCTIDNIFGAPVSAATAAIVMVDSDGRLGTVTMDGPDPGGFSPKGGIRPQAIPDAAAKQAMFNLKVQNLRATATQQQQQIETLTAQLKEHATQIQKVNAQLEMNKPPPHP